MFDRMPAKKPATTKKTKAITLIKKNVGKLSECAPHGGALDRLTLSVREKGESAGDVRRRVVELLRGDPDMAKFVRVADALPSKRTATADVFPSLDLMAERSGVRPAAIVGALGRALFEFNQGYDELARALASRAAPAAMQVLADQALKPGSVRDRDMLFRITRHIPIGGGMTINANAQALALQKSTPMPAAAVDVEQEEETAEYTLPNFEDSVKTTALAIRQKGAVA